jgi:nicotinate dehydrogenase subunit A
MPTITVNGKQHRVDAAPSTALLHVLRNDLKLNGAKFGCGLGQCGACTVLVDKEPVYSCLTPISVLEGRQVTTIEGLGTPDSPGTVQRAFIAEQAAQCGYCIPGMIMRTQALIEHKPRASEAELRDYMAPNLCRCGTQIRILRAIRRALNETRSASAGAVR